MTEKYCRPNFVLADCQSIIGTVTSLSLLCSRGERPVFDINFASLHKSFSLCLEGNTWNDDMNLPPDHPLELVVVKRDAGWQCLQDRTKLIKTPDNLEHLPCTLIADITVVSAVNGWLNTCPIPILRQFILDVLGKPSIGIPFFSLPASKSYHHSYPGGLAAHSLETAEHTIASCLLFPEHEQWLAATCALFHDIGKVKTFTSNGRKTRLGQLIPHEQLTMEVLAEPLCTLSHNWEDGAIAIRSILDWVLNKKKERPPLPCAIAVQAADRLSAAQNNRDHLFRSQPTWAQFTSDRRPGHVSRYWRLNQVAKKLQLFPS